MWVRTQFNTNIQTLRSDRGGEYLSYNLTQYLHSHGIQHQTSCPHTPEQNGVAERKHQHLIATTRTLLLQSQLPYHFWVDALLTATHIINRLPSKTLHMHSPYQLLYRSPPDYSYFRVFGCSCFPWQRPLTPHKLSPRAPSCIFIGYSPSSKGYRCYDPITDKVITSRHVTFNELSFPSSTQPPSHPAPNTPAPLLIPASCYHHNPSPSPHINPPSEPNTPLPNPNSPPPNHSNQPPPTPTLTINSPPLHIPTHPMTTRLKSGISKPKHIFSLYHSPPIPTDPTTYSQAAANPLWRQAMTEELLALHQQSTWRLVPRPPHQNIIGCRWTYRTKYHADGTVARHKARLVAKGFTQEFGTDYTETFSPVARIATIRIFLTVAVTHRWEIHQFDVSNAFLHGQLDEVLYMDQPPGFPDPHRPDHVCLLQKAIYGLKQSPRTWYSTFSKFLQRQGFQVSTADPSLLFYKSPTTQVYLLLYVDDILLAGNNASFTTSLTTKLPQEFRLKSLGPVSTFLGIHFNRTPTGLLLTQTNYLQHILQTAGFQHSKPVNTPVTTKATNPPDITTLFDQPTHYRRLAGSLQYLTLTRPDIAYAVNLICQHMHNPTYHHFYLLKRILRYLQATPTYGLPIVAGISTLTAYSDADWAGDSVTRRSTTGFCFYLGSTIISWKVHKQ